jgi:hypothetical protein
MPAGHVGTTAPEVGTIVRLVLEQKGRFLVPEAARELSSPRRKLGTSVLVETESCKT